MKLIVLCVLAAVAAARADYHDDVFHFSTLRSPVALSRPTVQYQQYQQYQPTARYYQPTATQYYQPTTTQYYQPTTTTQYYRPATTTYYQPATSYSREYFSQQQPLTSTSYVAAQQYSPAALSAYYSTPNVVLQTPVQTKQTVYQHQQVQHQPAAVFTSQVPVATTYSSLGTSSGSHLLGSLYSRSGASAYASAYNGPQYRILKQVQEVDPSGPYRMHYVTENGISATEEGSLTAPGPEGPAVAKQGSYSYTGPDGKQYSVSWVADENGFRASGAHLPKAPEVPAAAASLAYNPYLIVNKKK